MKPAIELAEADLGKAKEEGDEARVDEQFPTVPKMKPEPRPIDRVTHRRQHLAGREIHELCRRWRGDRLSQHAPDHAAPGQGPSAGRHPRNVT